MLSYQHTVHRQKSLFFYFMNFLSLSVHCETLAATSLYQYTPQIDYSFVSFFFFIYAKTNFDEKNRYPNNNGVIYTYKDQLTYLRQFFQSFLFCYVFLLAHCAQKSLFFDFMNFLSLSVHCETLAATSLYQYTPQIYESLARFLFFFSRAQTTLASRCTCAPAKS